MAIELDAGHGGRIACGIDPDTGVPHSAGIDSSSRSLRVCMWVWNPGSLAWERMKQPTLEVGDLTVTMGDLEALLSENYWKVKQFDYTSGNLDYAGFNTDLAAADGDADWYVWKYTWVGGNLTKIQGPRVLSWTGRAAGW